MNSGPNDPNAPGTPDPYPGEVPQQGGTGSGPRHGGGQAGAPQYEAPQYEVPKYEAPQAGGQPYGGQQPYPGGMNQMRGPGQPADLGIRFGARILDSIFVFIPLAIVTSIFGAIGAGAAGGFGGGGSFRVGMWIGGVILSLVYAVVTIGYFVWLEANRGQTFGKQICKLRTEGPSGGNPTMEQALKRNGYLVISAAGSIIASVISIGSVLSWFGVVISGLAGLATLAAVIVMAVSISESPTRQGKHDDFAGGTRVVTTA